MKAYQFFATPEEILTWSARWMTKFEIFAVVKVLEPSVPWRRFGPRSLQDDSLTPQQLSVVLFANEELPLPSGMLHEYLASHRDCVVIEIGPCTDQTLTESSIGCTARSASVLKIFKHLVKDASRELKCGLWGIPPSGPPVFYPKLRFSSAAEVLATNGLRLTAIAGATYFSVQQPPRLPSAPTAQSSIITLPGGRRNR